MITQEAILQLKTRYQTSELNIIREYFQHLVLSRLYALEGATHMLFKGGTALRIIYGSPRFSEDLDFSLFAIAPHEQQSFTEQLFAETLAGIEQTGARVELGRKPGPTAEGYYGDASFRILDYPAVRISINVSTRNGRHVKGEVDSIPNDFIPTYTLFHLPQELLVEEKIFGALLKRKKPRDFYDLYFIMRNRMLAPDQKQRLAAKKEAIETVAAQIRLSDELAAFLPQDQQALLGNFKNQLSRELNRQLS